MYNTNFLTGLDTRLRGLIAMFLLVLSIGFFSGIRFVHFTTDSNPDGIEENYLGNEENDEAEVMKFKKSQHEMLNIIHTHLLSMSVVFFLLGFLVYGCPIPSKLKAFLLFEPMLSVLFTFGSVYLLWEGIEWMSYITMISGILMTLSYIASVFVIFFTLFFQSEKKI